MKFIVLGQALELAYGNKVYNPDYLSVALIIVYDGDRSTLVFGYNTHLSMPEDNGQICFFDIVAARLIISLLSKFATRLKCCTISF